MTGEIGIVFVSCLDDYSISTGMNMFKHNTRQRELQL